MAIAEFNDMKSCTKVILCLIINNVQNKAVKIVEL